MTTATAHVLLVEDNPDDADILQEYLSEAEPPFEISVVERLSEALTWLERLLPDVILLDLSLPDTTGLDTFTRLHAAVPNTPIVVVTGLEDRDLALQAVQEGAQDYLTKGDLRGNTLAPAVRYAIERKRLESRIRDSESRYRTLVETAPGGVWSIDAQGVTTFVSQHMAATLGYSPEDMLGRPLFDFMSEEAATQGRQNMDRRRQGIAEVHDFDFRHRDGTTVHSLVATAPLTDSRGGFQGATAFVTDVTERHHQQAVERACARLREAVWQMRAPGDIDAVRAALRDALQALEVSYRFCTIGIAEGPPEAGAFMAIGDSDAPAGHLSEVVAQAIAEGQDNVRQMWRQGAVAYRPDLGVEDALHEREYVSRMCGCDVRCILDVPFSHGTLAVNSDQPQAFSERDIVSLKALAEVLSDGFRRLDDLRAMEAKEDQLRQSQKMEAIGRLAGGVAHDFNNLITVIKGYGQALRKRVGDDERTVSAVEQIIRAGDRAAGLVRQLLAFSRRQVLQPVDLDPGALIAELEKMLRRLIGEDVDLVTCCPQGLGQVHVDPGQFEQVIINLVVNACDAMPRGGRLTIEAANVHLDHTYADRRVEVAPGRYVAIAVSDSGQGMDEATQAQIFEPFFTTKEHGTGLGLSTVYGIVRQSGGYIWPYSEVGKGSTFKVYLPRADVPGAVAPDAPDAVAADAGRGHETILLVEDEDMVRELARDTLADAGYTVLDAADPALALEILARPGVTIDLLVTDVVMPGMNGPELAACVDERYPGTPVLFSSGYMDREIVASGVIAAGTPFLQKPYNPDDLVRKAREVLDQAAG